MLHPLQLLKLQSELVGRKNRFTKIGLCLELFQVRTRFFVHVLVPHFCFSDVLASVQGSAIPGIGIPVKCLSAT